MGEGEASERAPHILLVEDNPGDVRLVLEALKEVESAGSITVVSDGGQALALLQGSRGERRPDIILLDLNLPRENGKQVLERIKGDPKLRRIPVIILTSSTSPHDIDASYDLQANCYVIKPFRLEEFIQVVQAVAHFWLVVAQLPSNVNDGPYQSPAY